MMNQKEQEKFNKASVQIFDYYDCAYGRNALGQFMETIEKYPELSIKDIYTLLYEEDEDQEDEL